ncbi:MAG: recombinase family protein [Bdellovibrionaceae bacterium]|nr:recombinase family protein [Pseudobdellovibrionaceae bacterium]
MKNKSQPDLKATTSSSLLLGSYTRVSTDEQANIIEGSLDNQKYRMQSFVEIKNMQEPGWGHIVEYFIDDGYSAKDTNRPAYERMMKALKSGKINAIMVTELSRLSRNIPDFCDFHKSLENLGAKFFSIKEQFDSSTPSGKMMLYNMINLSQFEREQTSERVAINCHSRAQRGFLNGGPAILGYDKDPAKKATFIVNKEEAKLVRRIFELFMEQRSLSRTIDALSAEGIKPKSRGNSKDRLVKEGRWTVDSLSFVLKNHSYIAVREANKSNKNKDQAKLKVWQKYGTYRASWPAIIDEVTFKSVQQVLEENSERERMRLDTSEKRVFAASGLCQCEECGKRLVGQSAHGRKQVHRYYVHSSKKGDVITCSTKRIKADKIETKLAEHLSEILLQAGHFDEVEKRIREMVTSSPEQLKAERDRISAEVSKINLAVKNTFKIQAALDADSEAIKETAKELEELSRKKRHLESELENLRVKEVTKGDVDDAVIDLKERLSAFKRGWAKANAVMKKSLLKDLLYSILVSPKGLKIQYRLKHDLNKPVTAEDLTAAKVQENNVIALAEKRRAKSSGTVPDSASADASSPGGADFHNLDIIGSQVVEFGSESQSLPEFYQPHKKIDLFHVQRQAIYLEFAELYKNGLSLSDIAKQTGKSKSVIRASLLRDGIELRGNVAPPAAILKSLSGKSNTQPPYGFCYFQGKVVPDQKEYENLIFIYQLWKSGTNPNRIADRLTEKKIQPRLAKSWNRNSVINILNRFENKQIILKGGHLELR